MFDKFQFKNFCINLVDEERVVGEVVLSVPDDVEVGEARLDHQHVRPLRHVPLRCTVCKAPTTARQLITLSVSKSGSGLGSISEWSIETGRELDSVTQDGDFATKTIVRQDLLDGPDPAVHHVRGSHDVSPSLGKHQSLGGQQR